MKTPARNQDIKNLRTGLSALDIHEARNESAKLKDAEIIAAQIAYLGERYLLHPKNAPVKGVYNERGLPVAA